MYEAYRGGDKNVVPTEQPPTPQSVNNAVRFMYAGAAASLIGMIITLTTGVSKTAIHNADPSLTTTQVNNAAKFAVASGVIGGLIGIAIWILIARLCLRGSNGARITGTVFFGIDTLGLLLGFARPGVAVDKIYPLVVWLIGLGAVIYLWRRDSSAFFSRR
jgi:hypothetical protein